jgi:serine/arginine repetitive matrix protein 2
MYNGIGLKSVRGSSTNGFVQKNAGYIKPSWVKKRAEGEDSESDIRKKRKMDPEIIRHNRKRRVEVRLMQRRIWLEDHDVPEDKIEAEILKLREEYTTDYEEEEKERQAALEKQDGEIIDGGMEETG